MLHIKPLSDVTSLVVLKIPQLFVQTRRLAENLPLANFLARSEPEHIWLRNGFGALGFGTAYRFNIPAESSNTVARFQTAESTWETLNKNAIIDDDVHLPGSGLFAFGSFSFTEISPQGSTLLIPEILFFRADTAAWITLIAHSTAELESLSRKASAILAEVNTAQDEITSDKAETSSDKFHLAEIVELPKPEIWLEQVAATIAKINSGFAEKIVLSRSLQIALQQDSANDYLSAPKIAQKLSQSYPETWIFGVDNLIGATPELLIGRDTERTFSRVLAGTIGREENLPLPDLAQQLRSSGKDLHEHEIARESVITALAEFGEIRADAPYILELPNVLHLASDVEVSPNRGKDKASESPSLFSILARLHPSAALGGSPRKAALTAIAEIETVDRGRYGAPVGWISRSTNRTSESNTSISDNARLTDYSSNAAQTHSGTDSKLNNSGSVTRAPQSGTDFGQWCIALRCAQILSPTTLQAWAGGGIMADSVPETELAETTAKFRPIRDLFI